MATLIGRTLGKYRIVARLGRGGMAEVYKAYQPGLNRYVSIKVLHSHMIEEKNFVARFEREALAVGKLRHPNIVQAFDFDREDDIYFMAMEFIDGPTLKDELQARKAAGQPFSLKEIARIFIALCSAIDYAHARQMVHRDLKPANVMINQQGQIVLTDFGITRIIGGTQYTQTGALSGTPAYMSPEQGQGQHGDERSDIYSLGVMLYEMVTGAVPFDADTPFVIILKHISEPIPPPRRVVPNLPASVEQVILKAMAKDPAERYQRAGEMATALREAVNLAPGEEYLPLPTVAPRPQIKEMDHTTEHFPVRIKPPSGPLSPVGVTLAPAPHPATVIQTPPVQKRSMLPLLAGGGLLLLLILVGIAVGAFLYSRSRSSTDQVQQQIAMTTAAAINATETAVASATGTASAQAVAAAAVTAPTQTAQAATVMAEATAAQLTRDAELIAGVQVAVGATVTAVAQAAATATAAALEAGATQTAAAQATAVAAEQANVTQTAVAQVTAEAAAAANAATATAAAQATQTAQAQAAATAQARSAQVAQAQAAAPRGTFNDFETSLTWRRGDEPNGTFEQSTAEVHSGDYAGKLDYKFSTPNNDYVVFLWSQALGGKPNQITAWVYGDGAGHFLNIWVKDSAGETWQFSFGQIKHTGWQQMTAFLSPTQPWPAGHIDGPSNGVIDYPLTFQALVLDDGSDDFSGSGTIYVDDLGSIEGTLPPTAVPTSSPAIIFQADRTTLSAGGCAILSWSVENVSAVYLDGGPVTGQDSRQVCPNATTTYTLRVVKRDGSSSDVPVTITIQ
ncbi:MAG: protein kinase [Anaerolineales bacterium]|nr:protein kinase [Anaerolineales bacterium]